MEKIILGSSEMSRCKVLPYGEDPQTKWAQMEPKQVREDDLARVALEASRLQLT